MAVKIIRWTQFSVNKQRSKEKSPVPGDGLVKPTEIIKRSTQEKLGGNKTKSKSIKLVTMAEKRTKGSKT